MTRSLLTLGSTLSLLVVAASPVEAAGPKNCHFRLLGWTPDGAGYVLHMECVGENLAEAKLSKVGDENAEPVALCSTEACPTVNRASRHPKVRALKLRPSGQAPQGLKATATVRKGRAWTLTFNITQGGKTIRLGTRSVGGTRWRFKEAHWEPEGRAVAFSFNIEDGRDDKGEMLYVLPVPESVRPAATKAADPAIPFGLRFGMSMSEAMEHLGKSQIRPQKVGSSLELDNVKFLGHMASCHMDFRDGKRLSKVRFVSSAKSASEARRTRRDIKAALTKSLGRHSAKRGSVLSWIGQEVKLVYSESDDPTGAPGEVHRGTFVEFEPSK